MRAAYFSWHHPCGVMAAAAAAAGVATSAAAAAGVATSAPAAAAAAAAQRTLMYVVAVPSRWSMDSRFHARAASMAPRHATISRSCPVAEMGQQAIGAGGAGAQGCPCWRWWAPCANRRPSEPVACRSRKQQPNPHKPHLAPEPPCILPRSSPSPTAPRCCRRASTCCRPSHQTSAAPGRRWAAPPACTCSMAPGSGASRGRAAAPAVPHPRAGVAWLGCGSGQAGAGCTRAGAAAGGGGGSGGATGVDACAPGMILPCPYVRSQRLAQPRRPAPAVGEGPAAAGASAGAMAAGQQTSGSQRRDGGVQRGEGFMGLDWHTAPGSRQPSSAWQVWHRSRRPALANLQSLQAVGEPQGSTIPRACVFQPPAQLQRPRATLCIPPESSREAVAGAELPAGNTGLPPLQPEAA